MILKPLACLMLVPMLAHAGAPQGRAGWFTPEGSGSYSAVARSACGAVGGDTDLWSPDRSRRIAVRPADGSTALSAVDEGGREFPIDAQGWSCPEIGWSPGSSMFFVSYSDGGTVGNYHVSAYRFGAGGLEQLALAAPARRDFRRRYPNCLEPEEGNLAGVAWSADGARLLLAAQVLPHANCDNMGSFTLYEVAVPGGKILRRISQLEAKRRLRGLLGPALRAADDRCFTRPGWCRLPTLHRANGR